MRRATRETTYTTHSRHNLPALTVRSGEIFQVETELCSGPWLHNLDDRYDLACTSGPNPTVVVAVAGAVPGSQLAVRILDVELDSVGYTGFLRQQNPLSRHILDHDWAATHRTLAIRDRQIIWSDTLRIPVRPMIGTLGTAPEREEILNSKGGSHGGNLDVQEVTVGSTVYLPVAVPGALLHVGDVHAIQGDGEINLAGGVECRAVVTLQVETVSRFRRMSQVRIENEAYIMSVACERSAEEAFAAAARDLIGYMTEGCGMTEQEAYLLLGQVMEARCTQFVNPTRSYVCKIPRRYLEA
ncbi:MAG: acetamidase [Clostridiaceae bacterium]|nr:acetamidase [Clostridiaceae bacterium]